MAKILKSLVPFIVAVLCIVFMAGYSTSLKAKGQSSPNNNTEVKQTDECILIEAFVVEVKLDALYKLGVSPIGQKPNSASVENILNCIGAKDMAQVSTGLKVSLQPEKVAEARTSEKVYTAHTVNTSSSRGHGISKSYTSHEIGSQFSVLAYIRSHGAIFVNFEFNQNTFRRTIEDEEAPNNTINMQWSGDAYLEPGEPVIAAATQDEETAVFLVLCADVKGK